MKPKNAPQITWTDKLDVFVEHGHQQPVCPRHVKKIMESMQSHGFLASKPIQCFRDGKSLKIIDGHHRVNAAKNLGSPA
jgi:ParB-like chromosome segregation protein Spo0J